MGKSETNVSDSSEILPRILPFVGQLKLTVRKADNLAKGDILQKADPYVIVNYGEQTSKSKKLKNSLTPVWNHEATLNVDQNTTKDIEIKVIDWDRFGKDDL